MRMLDCYLPIFCLACDINQNKATPEDYPLFREKILALFNQALLACRQLPVDPQQTEDALFAVTVWFDEVILSSASPHRTTWCSELLQSHYFDTVIGGEEFFTRFDTLGENDTETRMVYLQCLLFGFHGKYHGLNNDSLIQYIASARQCLPEKWRQWPNNGLITPYDTGKDRPRRGGAFDMFYQRHSCLIVVVIFYAFLSGVLYLSF